MPSPASEIPDLDVAQRRRARLVGWLRAHIEAHCDRQAGFYGLDLYSLYASIEAVLDHLDRRDPAASERARRRYACFDQFEQDTQLYGLMASSGTTESCEDDVGGQLLELRA